MDIFVISTLQFYNNSKHKQLLEFNWKYLESFLSASQTWRAKYHHTTFSIYTNLQQQAFTDTLKIIWHTRSTRNLYNSIHIYGIKLVRISKYWKTSGTNEMKIFREKMSFTMINKFVPETILFSILASSHYPDLNGGNQYPKIPPKNCLNQLQWKMQFFLARIHQKMLVLFECIL